MGKPFPALGFSGGEYEEYYGIGFTVEKWYPLMKVGEEYTGRTRQFSFNCITFMAGVVFFLAIQWIIMLLTNKLKRFKS
ncbi:hypothetical protein [Pseudobacteroides cellulosolvens]|uniref:hypothetical protein n=1 Tax=Pseudobacteroides cellulosolvens TaxID=35825 RepID=UPI000566D182|nr:hypothetical protein [Pseudobacteroides cellulosolvens]